ncbi:mad2l1-1 [Symbiodinium sp. CCMP2592]|nr:mad2l1-1 [Symbiodinium sp. CCMP2592]
MRTDSGRIAELVSQEQLAESYQLSATCYKGIPLAGHSPCSRALRLQDLAFAVDEKLHMKSRFRRDVCASEVVGTLRRQRRGKYRSSADWWRDSIRVEFKSSKMSWVSGPRHWLAHFSTVKFASQGHPRSAVFDELMLGLYAPFGLYLLQYSGDFGRSRKGVATDHLGHSIVVRGPRNEECPQVALGQMLAKLEQSGCRLLAIVKW